MLADYLTFTQIVEIISLITVLFICGYSFRTYLLTKQRKHEYFAIAFLLIGVGIAFNILFNGQVQLSRIDVPFRGVLPITTAAEVLLFLAVLFRMAGYMTLFLITEEVHNWKVVFVSFVFVLLTSIMATDYYPLFHVVNFILLALVFTHFYKNFHVHSSSSSLLIMLAFGALALSQVPFSLVFIDHFFYNIGVVVRLVSFLLFLTALALIFKPRRSVGHARA
jgi:hypothetical protein